MFVLWPKHANEYRNAVEIGATLRVGVGGDDFPVAGWRRQPPAQQPLPAAGVRCQPLKRRPLEPLTPPGPLIELGLQVLLDIRASRAHLGHRPDQPWIAGLKVSDPGRDEAIGVPDLESLTVIEHVHRPRPAPLQRGRLVVDDDPAATNEVADDGWGPVRPGWEPAGQDPQSIGEAVVSDLPPPETGSGLHRRGRSGPGLPLQLSWQALRTSTWNKLQPRLDRDRKARQRLDLVEGSAALGRQLTPGSDPPELVWVERFDCAIVAATAVYIAEIVSDVRGRVRLIMRPVTRLAYPGAG